MAFDRNEAADVAFGHRPVLLDECMEGLVIRPGGIYLDGTLGRAGHSWEIVRRLNAGGRLIGLDRDETALEAARQRLAPYADRVTLVHSNFSRVAEVLDELGIPAVDGMLFDLGVSSPQLDDAQRGFSYMHDAPLDMRMDRTAGLTARTVVNEWSYEELRRILYEYGEERYAPAIARRIVVANALQSGYIGAITVAAYSYMALVPIVQPPVIRLLTTKKERLIRMPYEPKQISKTTRILFPIVITIITGIFAPKAVALVGFLMFGNLIRECGVLNSLSETAQKVLANLITIFLGISIAFNMHAVQFLKPQTLLIMGLGLVAFIFDTAGGVLVAKFLNLFLPKGRKINPMIGAAGISAFPMSSRVIHKMGLKEDPQNFLLMHTVGVNVSGQIASVIAGGLIMSLVYTIG